MEASRSENSLHRRVIGSALGNTHRKPITIDSKKTSDKEQQTNPTQDMLENIGWVLASGLAIYFSNIIDVILHDQTVYRTMLILALSLISVNVLIAGYLIVWVSMVNKVNSDKWNEIYPTLIPIATGSAALGSVLLAISIWPYYTWFTLPLLFTIFMGLLVVLLHVPNIL